MSQIRPLVLGIFIKDDRILAMEGYDEIKKEILYRPLGGEIELGEKGENALRREIKEEINAEINGIEYLGVIENIFTYNGQPGHEIDLIYRAEFIDLSFYDQSEINGLEADTHIKAVWIPLKVFKESKSPLYPAGLINLL